MAEDGKEEGGAEVRGWETERNRVVFTEEGKLNANEVEVEERGRRVDFEVEGKWEKYSWGEQ